MVFHEYLVAKGVVKSQPEVTKRGELLAGFERWMVCHKGVRQVTLANHMYYLEPFIVTIGDKPELYSSKAVRRHLWQVSTSSRVATIQAASASIRTFLRYLVATGQFSNTLIGAAPKIACWSLSTLPRFISHDDIEQLIDSCSMTTLTARRERAVLLLLSRLALRACDVAGLELTDIDWREGRIRVAGKNRREFWLPMLQDVGDTLVDYIQNERPDSRELRVILKCIAPMRPASRTLISSIVRRAIDRTSMDTPSAGAHLLRHSMLAQGATLAQIGSVLCHSSINTTAIYAKVDINLLSGAAAPWPSSDDDQHGEIVPMTGAGSC
jgi:integrase/recombinase XerD